MSCRLLEEVLTGVISISFAHFGMWNGVIRLKFGFCFRNMDAEVALSKYAVILFGLGGSSSGLAQSGGSSLSMNAFNALNLLLFDLPADTPRQLVFPVFLVIHSSFLFLPRHSAGAPNSSLAEVWWSYHMF